MTHLPDLIRDLALILMSAGAVTLLCRQLRQPAVLGYIIAGFLVSPYAGWLPTVSDAESIKVWAEIGVIFLLFGLGLEFSFKKLVRVGGSASITAAFEVGGMLLIGYATGKVFGWSNMDSLFLGGILAISSTTIIIRAFEEVGVKTRGFVGLVFGVLIVEDLFAILLLVLLSTMAASQTFSGEELAISTVKLVFFLILWFVSGIFLIPTFLKRTRKLMTPETMLVVALGLCFLMVVLATQAGFSPALGAFIMGSILAETVEGERIEHLIMPVKDLFAAIFFVSVGMMIDPVILQKYWVPILVITIVTIVGKSLTTGLGALLSGRSLRHSIQAGMSLAQIGEFSFIIASLGLSLKVTSDFLYPVAIGVSALTTFTTPYMIRWSDKTVTLVEGKLPKPWLEGLERFGTESRQVTHTSEWKAFLKKVLIKASANAVVIIAIFALVHRFLNPLLAEQIESPLLARWCGLLIALILAAPFLWALAFGRAGGQESQNLLKKSAGTWLAMQAMRWIVTVALLSILASRFVSAGGVLTLASAFIILMFFIFSRHLGKIYGGFEKRFIRNLTQKDNEQTSKKLPPLAPWNAHLVELEVSPDSQLVGKALIDSMVRENFGVTIALIERGHKIIPVPGRNEIIFPFDHLHVIGTDEQIQRFRQACEEAETSASDWESTNFSLVPVVIDASSPYANKTIRDCGLREATQGLVVGIERANARTLNPDSGTVIEVGDLLWVVADESRARSL